MKKLVCVALSLLLALAVTSVALAVPFVLETAGVVIDVPEGMTGADYSDENAYALGITVDGNPALTYVYALRYMEEYEGMWLEDLSAEDGEKIAQGLAAALENPVFDQAGTEDYPLLLAANGEGTQLHYISLLNGWFCDVAAVKTDGVTLTQEEVEVAAQLLMSIEFLEDVEE